MKVTTVREEKIVLFIASAKIPEREGSNLTIQLLRATVRQLVTRY